MVTTRSQTKKTKSIVEKYSQNHLRDDSDEQPSESGALIGSNDDILTEILLRLPAFSILRFKSVSKHWHSLLSHRHFTVRYDNLFKYYGFISENEYYPFDVENQDTTHYSIPDICVVRHGIQVEQSCNGLLLCRSYTTEIDAHKYYVLNPTTRQFAIIPSVPGGKAVRKTITFMALAYHQTDCVHYKVVCIRELDGARHLFQILIYSSDTRKWKISVESFCNRYFRIYFFSMKKAVYWNGAIHWFPSHRNHVYFDIISERMQTLPAMSGKVPRHLWESRGHLYLILTDYLDYSSSSAFDINEMLSDNSGWFVKYRVDLDELTSVFPEMINHRSGLRYYVMDVVDVVRGEKEEDTFLVLRIPNMMLTYNIHDKSFKLMFDNLHNNMDDGFPDYHRHTETLTSF